MRENENATLEVRRLAAIREDNAETGVHELFKELGIAAPVEISTVNCGDGLFAKYPFIKLSTWMQFLLDSGRLSRQMTGTPTLEKMEHVLEEFWSRYRQAYPQHGVFSLEADGTLVVARTIPFFSHSDEGRAYKQKGIWILSSSGAIGRGTSKFLNDGRHRAPLKRNSMGLNFTSKTWASQFLSATMLRDCYSEDPDRLEALIREYALDVEKLCHEGIASSDGTRYWFLHLATKGDLPMLTKVGCFKRAWGNVPRAGSSRKACQGICHLCLGGREIVVGNDLHTTPLFPFEDLGPTAAWRNTLGAELPFDSMPAILTGVPLGGVFPGEFFALDIWHNFHLGLAKHWVASALVSIVELGEIPGQSVDSRFEWLTSKYKAFCASTKANPWITEISRDTLVWPYSSVCPCGKWNKGSASTAMMMFLEYIFTPLRELGEISDPILKSVVS